MHRILPALFCLLVGCASHNKAVSYESDQTHSQTQTQETAQTLEMTADSIVYVYKTDTATITKTIYKPGVRSTEYQYLWVHDTLFKHDSIVKLDTVAIKHESKLRSWLDKTLFICLFIAGILLLRKHAYG